MEYLVEHHLWSAVAISTHLAHHSIIFGGGKPEIDDFEIALWGDHHVGELDIDGVDVSLVESHLGRDHLSEEESHFSLSGFSVAVAREHAVSAAVFHHHDDLGEQCLLLRAFRTT